MYKVIKSPWENVLPIGTEIIPTEPRTGHDGYWFKRADGKILFEDISEEVDGKFRLWKTEFKKIEQV